MASTVRIEPDHAMATPWRRRQACRLVGTVSGLGVLREVSAKGALIETSARAMIGDRVTLHHPEAGAIDAVVSAAGRDGLRLAFHPDRTAMAFALTAITADMSLPG